MSASPNFTIVTLGVANLSRSIGMPAEPPAAYPGITVALNFGNEQKVDAALAQAVQAGARLVKPAERAD